MTDSSRKGKASTKSNIPITISVADLAAMSENPQLWLAKYVFYMVKMGFTQKEAIMWCNADVQINTEVRQEFGLRSAQEEQVAGSAFTEADMQQLYESTLIFCKKNLGMDDKDARQFAEIFDSSLRETEEEFQPV